MSTAQDIVKGCIALGLLPKDQEALPWTIRRLYPSRADRSNGAWSWALRPIGYPPGYIEIGSQWPAGEIATNFRKGSVSAVHVPGGICLMIEPAKTDYPS